MASPHRRAVPLQPLNTTRSCVHTSPTDTDALATLSRPTHPPPHPSVTAHKQTVFSNYQAITSKTFVVSLLMEAIGVMVFAFLGGTVNDKVHGPW